MCSRSHSSTHRALSHAEPTGTCVGDIIHISDQVSQIQFLSTIVTESQQFTNNAHILNQQHGEVDIAHEQKELFHIHQQILQEAVKRTALESTAEQSSAYQHSEAQNKFHADLAGEIFVHADVLHVIFVGGE